MNTKEKEHFIFVITQIEPTGLKKGTQIVQVGENLWLTWAETKKDYKSLFENFHANALIGDVDLSGVDIGLLPDNLTVEGDLDVSYSDLTHLPENLMVGGDLNLRETSVVCLPNDLKIGGNILIGTEETIENHIEILKGYGVDTDELYGEE